MGPDDVTASGSATATAPADMPYVANPNAGADPSPASAPSADAAPYYVADPNAESAPPPAGTPATAPQAQAPHKNWFQKVYDGVLTGLGGATTTTFTVDQGTGKMVRHDDPATAGQKWKRIVAGALSGLAAGGGQTGPGAGARSLSLGVGGGIQAAQQAQQQQRQQAYQASDQEMKLAAQKASIAHMGQETLKLTWDAKMAKAQALQGMADQEYAWHQRFTDAGQDSVDGGIFKNVQDAMQYAKDHPGAHGEHADGQWFFPAHVNNDGEVDGNHAYWFAPSYLDGKTDKPEPVFKLGKGKDGQPEVQSEDVPAGQPRRAFFQFQAGTGMAAVKTISDLQDSKAKQDEAGARRLEAQSKIDDAPLDRRLKQSEIDKNEGEANRANRGPAQTAAEARQAEQDYWGPGGGRGFNQWHSQEVKPMLDTETSYDLASQVHNLYYDANGKALPPPATGAPAMLLLSQHMQTTFGSVKGGRVTKDLIQEHLGARSVSDDAQVAIQKFYNGSPVSTKQMDAFTSLIGETRDLKWRQVANDALREGRPLERINFPEDLRQKWGLGPAYGAQTQQQPQGAPRPGGGGAGQQQFQKMSSDGKWGWNGTQWVSTAPGGK